MDHEPVAIVNAINGALGATLAVLVAAGVIDQDLSAALLAALSAWVIVANLLFVRPKVAAPNTVAGLTDALAEAKAKAGDSGQ